MLILCWIRKYFIYICKTSKVIEGYKSLSSFSVNPTLPLLDGPLTLPSPNCVDLSLTHSSSRSVFPSRSLTLSKSLSISLFWLTFLWTTFVLVFFALGTNPAGFHNQTHSITVKKTIYHNKYKIQSIRNVKLRVSLTNFCTKKVQIYFIYFFCCKVFSVKQLRT